MDWQEIMGRFKTICKDPYVTSIEWKKKNQKKVIGWFMYDTPEEIIHASGSLPLAVLGSGKHLIRCEAYAQNFICSLVRSSLEDGLDGSLDWIDGIVFPHVCDSAQNLAGVWAKNCPTPHVDSLFWPKSLNSPSAREYAIEEVKRFTKGLETYLKKEISDEAIRASIRLYNKTRALQREIASHTTKLTCREKYEILKSALLMPKEEFNTLAVDLLEHLRKKSPIAKERIPLAISGIMWEPPEVLDLFDDLGAVIVADDFCTGSRYFAADVPESRDPVVALVDYHLERIPFACYHYAGHARADFLKDQIKKSSAKGLVFLHIKFCDPEDYDYPDLAAALDKDGVPNIHLESEFQTASLGQIRTRLEAFLEIVGGN